MRCNTCDSLLSAFESTRRHHKTKDFMDLCQYCLPPNVPTIDRMDLLSDSDTMNNDGLFDDPMYDDGDRAI